MGRGMHGVSVVFDACDYNVFFLFLYRLFLTACSIYSHCHALRNRVFFWKILFLFLTFFFVCVILFFGSCIFF